VFVSLVAGGGIAMVHKLSTVRSEAVQSQKLAEEARARAEQARDTATSTTLELHVPEVSRLYIDGIDVGAVGYGDTVKAPSGKHAIRILMLDGKTCEDTMTLEPGTVRVIECGATPRQLDLAPAAKLVLPQHTTQKFENLPLETALAKLSDACGVSTVVSDDIQAKVTADLTDVPCDQAIEVILESNGLWYEYFEPAKLLRISPRRQLDAEREQAAARSRRMLRGDDPLPEGTTVDLDFKDAPIREILRVIGFAGGVNIVIPDAVQGKTNVRFDNVPWRVALQGVLGAHGLWYRYRENGKIVRVAPRRELDAEAEAEAARERAH
jgi:hypothetical protein